MGANVSPKSIPSRCLNPRATSLDSALLTQPNSSDFQLNNHLVSMTLPIGCYEGSLLSRVHQLDVACWLHHSKDGRCALVPCPVWALKAGSAVHKHNDVPRASQGSRERSKGVDVDQVKWSLCPGCGAVWCRRADALGHRTFRAWCQLPYKLDTVLLGSDFQYTRMGVGKGNVVVVNIYYSLFIFVDEQSTRGEHCRSHTITITQNRRRLFSLFPCRNNRTFHAHPCTRVAPPARTTRTQCFLCNGGSYTTVLYGGRGVCECRQRVTRACVCSLHYSSSTQGRSIPPTGEHETTIE